MSVYRPKHDPPSAWDRALLHPGVAVFGLWAVPNGALIFADPFIPDIVFSRSLGEIPYVLATAIGLFLMLGGAFVVVGVLNHWPSRAHAWALEACGWVWIAGGYLAYTVAVINTFPSSINAWGSSLAIVTLAVLRILALWSIYRAALSQAHSRVTGQRQAAPSVE